MAYRIRTKKNVVVRGGFGLFHGIIPAPLLACQIPSCGGTIGKYPGRPFEDNLNAKTELFAFASGPAITGLGLQGLMKDGAYPDNTTDPFTNPFPGCTPISNCGFFGPSVIVRFDQNHKNPYGIQASLAVEFEPLPDTTVSISGLHIRGVHLGSFFNVNQPDPTQVVTLHDSQGRSGPKNEYCGVGPVPCPFNPGVRTFPIAVYFEATSRWDSQYDGLLINLNKRLTHNFSYGVSYTWSKSIDDGPNPSFVLIPQDSQNFRAERARSSDDVRNRLVLNATVTTPKTWNAFARDFQLGLITTIQSPMRFTKFAGFDANGDIFGNNDRVGIEPRNTFIGDNFRSVDLRIGLLPVQSRGLRLPGYTVHVSGRLAESALRLAARREQSAPNSVGAEVQLLAGQRRSTSAAGPAARLRLGCQRPQVAILRGMTRFWSFYAARVREVLCEQSLPRVEIRTADFS
jgi:hypothetical protein